MSALVVHCPRKRADCLAGLRAAAELPEDAVPGLAPEHRRAAQRAREELRARGGESAVR